MASKFYFLLSWRAKLGPKTASFLALTLPSFLRFLATQQQRVVVSDMREQVSYVGRRRDRLAVVVPAQEAACKSLNTAMSE